MAEFKFSHVWIMRKDMEETEEKSLEYLISEASSPQNILSKKSEMPGKR